MGALLDSPVFWSVSAALVATVIYLGIRFRLNRIHAGGSINSHEDDPYGGVQPRAIFGDSEEISLGERELLGEVFSELLSELCSGDDGLSDDEKHAIYSLLRDDLLLDSLLVQEMESAIQGEADRGASADEILSSFSAHQDLVRSNKVKILEGLLRVAYSDGTFDKPEVEFIHEVCEWFGISESDFSSYKTRYEVERLVLRLLNAITRLPESDVMKEGQRRLTALLETVHSPFLITVLGEFSAGKSSFLNALVKKRLLAMKVRPTTATITKLHYGTSSKLEVMYNSGEEKSFDRGDLHSLTVEQFVDEDKILDDIHYVSLEVEDEILRTIDFADTPGFNSSNAQHTEITTQFIAYSDAIIWLFDANQMAKKSTFDLIETHCKYQKPIGIINKVDQIDEDEIEIIDELKADLMPHTLATFPVSAKNALSPQASECQNAGMDAVREYLRSNVIPNASSQKTQVLLAKLIDIVLTLSADRKKQVAWLEIMGKKQSQYAKDYEKLEEQIEAQEFAETKLQRLFDDDDISAYEILPDFEDYFKCRATPNELREWSLKCSEQLALAESHERKFDSWSEKNDKESARLDVALDEIEDRWHNYSKAGLGLKKWLVDDLLNFGTDERTQLNKDSESWDIAASLYNSDLAAFKKFGAEWVALDDAFVEEVILLFGAIVDNVEAHRDTLIEEAARLEFVGEKIERQRGRFNYHSQFLQVFDTDIFAVTKEIAALVETKDSEGLEDAISDFSSMTSHFQKYQQNRGLVVEKGIYERSHVRTIIDKTSQITTMKVAAAHTHEKETRVAPKIK